MSGDDVLSEHDEQVLEAVGGTPRENGADRNDEEYITREEFEEFRSEVASMIGRLEAKINALEGNSPTPHHDSVIDQYAAMVEDGEEEFFENQQSLRRAVEIHRHWDDWKQSIGTSENRREGISTAKKSVRQHQPAEIRVLLEESDAPGDSLQSSQVQRAMQKLGEKSFRESEDEIAVEHDDHGRIHVTGGLYEYHHRSNPSNEHEETKHVVVKTR